WLAPPPLNFFLRQADVSQARQPGTGEWLLADPDFQEWKSAGGTLWCHGIPGAGKTILVSMVVDHLSAESLGTDTGVACIYLNHKESETQTPSNLLANLWKQLVLGRDISAKVQKMYKQQSEKGTTPSIDEIQDVLVSLVVELEKVYIVVDAVDEYPEIQRHILLTRLAAMGRTVNLMITSRPHIAHDMPPPQIKTLEIRANNEDVRRYIEEQIKMSPRLLRHVQKQPDLREEIQSKIGTTVDGMFLLAKLHMDSLRREHTIKAVRDTLNNLPKDLNYTYENAMKRIETQDQEDKKMAHSTLIWVANAKRPLKVSELQKALAIEPGSSQLTEESEMDIEIILSVCAGLVIVDMHHPVVRLVHYTAQEYLNSVQDQQYPDAQMEISLSLLTYLKFTDCVGLLTEVLLLDNGALVNVPAAKYGSALQAAALQGKYNAVSLLLERGADVNAQGGDFGSALLTASTRGYLNVVQLLLDHGVNVNAQAGKKYSNALQAASFEGHEDIVQLLLAKGANVTAEGGQYGSALQAASFQGHRSIVQLLLDGGADVNAQGGQYSTALQAASLWDHETIVALLLDRGVDVNANDGGHSDSALQAALWDRENIVRLLLDRGADVNANDGGYYGGALQAAALQGHENIVQLLLDHGANVSAQGGNHGSPLQAALFSGHHGIAHILIEKGAQVPEDTHIQSTKEVCGSFFNHDFALTTTQNSAQLE
ncbi:ankyrin repeat-containing domain protein, partial [Mycena capillaripes]